MGISAAATNRLRNKADTPNTRQARPSEAQTPASISTLRVLTAPTMRTECGVPPGIQTALSGGATQAPSGVLTAITPRAA